MTSVGLLVAQLKQHNENDEVRIATDRYGNRFLEVISLEYRLHTRIYLDKVASQ